MPHWRLPVPRVASITVNSEILERVYFRETSHVQSFVKIKASRNGENTLSTTDIGKSYPSREIFPFNAILENEILAKISGFTVLLK